MNRLVRGSVILAAVVFVGACGGLDTGDIDQTELLVADPGVVYVANNDSQAVFVEAHNSLGQQLEGDFTITNVGPGIVVNLDTLFAPRPGVGELPTRVRLFVRATNTTTFVDTDFTVSANGKSFTIPVRILPGSLDIPFSATTANFADTLSMTAPAGVLFTDSSTITIAGQPGLVTGVSPDGSQIFFQLPPNVNSGTATFTNVQVSYLPGQVFTVPTTGGTVTTPTVPTVPATFSTFAPNIGDTVVMTMQQPWRALPNVQVAVGGIPALMVGVSPDSLTVRFLVAPNTLGLAIVNGIIRTDNHLSLSLPSDQDMDITAVSNYTNVDDPFASAPPIIAPTVVGDTNEIYDAYQVVDQYYKLTISVAGQYRLVLSWPGTGTSPDVDGGVINPTFTAFSISGCGTAANPEACSSSATTLLQPGTYFVNAFLYDGAAPDWYRIRIIKLQ